MSEQKESMTVAEKIEWIKFKLNASSTLLNDMNEYQQNIVMDSIYADLYGWEIAHALMMHKTPSVNYNTDSFSDIVDEQKETSQDEIKSRVFDEIDSEQIEEQLDGIANELKVVQDGLEKISEN